MSGRVPIPRSSRHGIVADSRSAAPPFARGLRGRIACAVPDHRPASTAAAEFRRRTASVSV